MQTQHVLKWPALLAVALICSACSGQGAQGIVEGQATYNGQALKEGLIRFVPVGGDSQTADAAIVDGKYSATVPVGEFRVEITSSKVVGKSKMYDMPNSPAVDVVEQIIPTRFNVNSELRVTVKKGKIEKNFDLSDK